MVLDSGNSPSKYLYGMTLRMPGEFVISYEFTPEPQIFLKEFREHMGLIKPRPVEHRHKRKNFFYKSLNTCTHLFHFSNKGSLESQYTGPYEIGDRASDRVHVNSVSKRVSVENVKPTYFVPDNVQIMNRSKIKESNVVTL